MRNLPGPVNFCLCVCFFKHNSIYVCSTRSFFGHGGPNWLKIQSKTKVESWSPVRDEKVNKVNDGQKKVSREVVEVKFVHLGVVQRSPEGDGDQQRQGGGDVGQDPEEREEKRQSSVVALQPFLAFDNVQVFVKFPSL